MSACLDFFVNAADVVGKHMASLRSQYLRQLRPLPSGSGKRKKTERQRWLEERLEFLKPFVQKCRPSSSTMVAQVAHILVLT